VLYSVDLLKGEIDVALSIKKITTLEMDYDTQAVKLAATLEKLEETTSAANECDR